MPGTRHLVWEGCFNARDLGGYPTEDGGETRYGFAVRSDDVSRLTDAGWRAAAEYGVRTILDLRLAQDHRVAPPADVPATALHVSLLPDFGHPDWAEINALAAASDPPDWMRVLYREFLDRYRQNFGRAIAAVANAESTVLVFCQFGKDRTGLISALMLRLAGVGVDTILAEYALSEERLRPFTEPWVARAESEDERRQRLRVVATSASAMAEALAEVERLHGTVHAYLLEAGVPPDDLMRLRERLRA